MTVRTNRAHTVLVPLESIRLRLSHAESYLGVLKKRIGDAAEIEAYGVRRQLEAKGTDHVYYAVVREGFLEQLSLTVSDCLHNLRSTLDNLVFALAVTNLGRKGEALTGRQAKSLQFPICDESGDFADECKRGRLFGLSTEAFALVETHQPCSRGYGDPLDSPIGHLRDLQNVDKHRYLLSLRAEAGESFTTSGPTKALVRFSSAVSRGESVEDGAEVARFVFRQPEPRMDVEFKPTFLVTFDDRERVLVSLDSIRTQIATIVHHAEQLSEV